MTLRYDWTAETNDLFAVSGALTAQGSGFIDFGRDENDVITSYSIHYTKLYDLITVATAEFAGSPVLTERQPRNVPLRITSYNVCYTKLLRGG